MRRPSARGEFAALIVAPLRSRRAPSGTGIKDTCPVNGSRPSIASAMASAARRQPSYLRWCTASCAASLSQTALRTRESPGATRRRAGTRGRRSAGWPQRSHTGSGTGCQRLRQSEQIRGSPSRRRIGASQRRHAGGSSQRSAPRERGAQRSAASTAARMTSSGACGPGNQRSKRRGALRHQHRAAVRSAKSRGAHAPAPRRSRLPSTPGRGRPRGRRHGSPERQWVAGDETERRRVDHARAHSAAGAIGAPIAGAQVANALRASRPSESPPPRRSATRGGGDRRARAAAGAHDEPCAPAADRADRAPRGSRPRRCCRRPVRPPRPRRCCTRRRSCDRP